jgi:hypothetical protein
MLRTKFSQIAGKFFTESYKPLVKEAEDIHWVWWLISVIPATQYVEIGKSAIRGQPEQKVSKIPISPKPDMVVHTCGSK